MKRQRLHTRMLLVIDENHALLEKITEHHRPIMNIPGDGLTESPTYERQADDPGRFRWFFAGKQADDIALADFFLFSRLHLTSCCRWKRSFP